MLFVNIFDKPGIKKIKHALNRITKEITKYLKDNLVSLYLDGIVLEKGIPPNTVIRLYCIVQPDFDFKKENELNNLFVEQKSTFCSGLDIRMFCIPLSDLAGSSKKSSLLDSKPGLALKMLIKELSHYKKLYGVQVDFSMFSNYPTILEELSYTIRLAEDKLVSVAKMPDAAFSELVRALFMLCKTDAQMHYGYRHDEGSGRLVAFMKKEKSHIVHLCMRLRREQIMTSSERKEFIVKAMQFIADLKKRSNLA